MVTSNSSQPTPIEGTGIHSSQPSNFHIPIPYTPITVGSGGVSVPGLGGLETIVGKLTDPNFWKATGLIIAGGIGVLLGILMLSNKRPNITIPSNVGKGGAASEAEEAAIA